MIVYKQTANGFYLFQILSICFDLQVLNGLVCETTHFTINCF